MLCICLKLKLRQNLRNTSRLQLLCVYCLMYSCVVDETLSWGYKGHIGRYRWTLTFQLCGRQSSWLQLAVNVAYHSVRLGSQVDGSYVVCRLISRYKFQYFDVSRCIDILLFSALLLVCVLFRWMYPVLLFLVVVITCFCCGFLCYVALFVISNRCNKRCLLCFLTVQCMTTVSVREF